jgi:hypothetical protein
MDAFFVTDQEETKSAAQGGLLELTGSPRLHFQFTREGRGLENFSILVIRGGEVIRTVAAQGDTAFTVDDPVIGGSGTTFYRLIVMNNDWPVLASNPVFARIDAASETRSQQRVPATGAGS